jgi:phosphatidate cytidylyltransferase
MLKQRITTAILMLSILMPAILHVDSSFFVVVTLCAIAVAGWEWARLCSFSPLAALLYGFIMFAICVSLWCTNGILHIQSMAWVLSALWIVFSALALRAGVPLWARIPRWFRALVGIFALAGAWSALVVARGIGVEMLLSIFCLVWIADIGAYFSGKRWSLRIFSRKLAPEISPGKSWEGVFGGFFCVIFFGVCWWKLGFLLGLNGPNLYSRVGESHGWFGFFAAMTVLTAISVVGDLMESFVKRGAGVKDSSQLLPGHGGVLDRIDALLPVFPMAVMLGLL